MEKILEIKNLRVDFAVNDQKIHAVKDFSFHLNKNETLAIVGESGSGKSVCALSITRLLERSGAIIKKGSIAFKGLNLAEVEEDELRKIRGKDIAYIFQEPSVSLNPLQKIGKQITERLVIQENEDTGKATEKAVELLGLAGIANPEKRIRDFPHTFSGGEKQRIMIAMALMTNPEIIIADEPTTALDVIVQKQIIELLLELKERFSSSLILITHDLTLVKKYAQRVVVVKDGCVVETGKMEEIFTNPKEEYTKFLLKGRKTKILEVGENEPDILTVRNLNVFYNKKKTLFKEYPGFHAVKDVNFSVQKGSSLGIVGESGSGKSSLARALLRLIPSSGEIYFLGKNLSSLTGEALRKSRKNIQVVFQDPFSSFNPRITIGGIVEEGLVANGEKNKAERKKKALKCLEETGLGKDCYDRYPHEFSGGQRQRIAIARAIIMEPALIILDEPTSSLDKSIQHQILELLRNLQKKYFITFLFISHDLDVIKGLCHKTAVMKQGEIVEIGFTEKIFTRPSHEYTKALIAARL